MYRRLAAALLANGQPHEPLFDAAVTVPRDFYALLQRNSPDPKAMIPIEQTRPVRGYKERFVLEMSERHLNTLPGEK